MASLNSRASVSATLGRISSTGDGVSRMLNQGGTIDTAIISDTNVPKKNTIEINGWLLPINPTKKSKKQHVFVATQLSGNCRYLQIRSI